MLANYFARENYDNTYVNQTGDILQGDLNMNNHRILNIGNPPKHYAPEQIVKKILGGEQSVFIVSNKDWKCIIVNFRLSKSFTSAIIPREFVDKEIVVDVAKYYKKQFKYIIYAVVKLTNLSDNGHFDLAFLNVGFYRTNRFRKRVGDSSYFISSVIIL